MVAGRKSRTGVRNLTTFQAEALLEWFFYNLTMEHRGKLMSELPQAYNAYCGSEIVQVVRVSDGSPILAPQ